MSANTITYACGGRSAAGSEGRFFGVLVLLFAGSAALTIGWCGSMSRMGGMPMPGGWTMSMTWMQMSGQTWSSTMASFVEMWVAMMVAMMLPSLAPALCCFRRSAPTIGDTRCNWLTVQYALGYFLVWTVIGVVVFPLGVTLSALQMRLPELARAVPLATGLVVLAAGALQFTAWKARLLACCREAPGNQVMSDGISAWRGGLRLGLHCAFACAGMTAILLVVGVMDLRAMLAVTAAITAERLVSPDERIARAIGAVVVAGGLCMIVLAA